MLTAKALGVRVPEFGVGFGPALVKKKIGNTVYSFRIILLGGFAKMAGMGDGAEGRDTYYAKALWRRALIILAGPVANLLAAVAILACVYMFQGVVTDVKPVVSAVEQGSMAQEVGIERGDRIVGLDGGTVKTWEGFERRMSGREVGERVSVTVVREDHGQARGVRRAARNRREGFIRQRYRSRGHRLGGEHSRQPGLLPAASGTHQPQPGDIQPVPDPTPRRRTPVLYSGGEGLGQARQRADNGQDRRVRPRSR